MSVVFLAVVLLVVQHNLSADTKARHENEFENGLLEQGTFPKWEEAVTPASVT